MAVQIAVKLLASLNQPGACERCFWLRVRQNQHMPYTIFPGIFNSLDAYSKHLVGAAYLQAGLPPWLARAAGLVDPVPVPHYTRFKKLDTASGIILCGAPDAMFRRFDRSYAIADFKTARYTPGQEALIGLYQAQLNGYAWIGDALGYTPVSHLCLVYTEPVTQFVTADVARLLSANGFLLRFAARMVEVENHASTLIPVLLHHARVILDSPLPTAAADCKDCALLTQLVAHLGEARAGV